MTHEQPHTRTSFAERARHLGKSARTRARIMDAAVNVVARHGFEAPTANEIAREADIAHGTFYLHFKDKEELSQAIVLEMGREVATRLNAALHGVSDAAERCSWATRQFIEYACAHPELGWALYRGIWARPDLRRRSLDYMREDIEQGVAQGIFTVEGEIDDLLLGAIISMLSGCLFERLSGKCGPECGSRAAELQLRMLGVPLHKAHEIAWRPYTGFNADTLES